MKHRTFFTGISKRIMLLSIASTIFNHVLAHELKDSIRMIPGQTVPGADSIILQSPDVACRGASPVLTVTGVNVTWYADPAKTVVLGKGNTYQPRLLDSTTTFYLTQTINEIESAATAIKIEIVEAFLVNVTTTPASCGKNDGTMTVTGKGGTERYPLKYKLNDGPLQLSGFFDNLAGETYTLTIQSEGCFGTSEVKVEQKPSPIISLIEKVDPQCGNSNGSVRIAAYGGNGALTYSLDGRNFSQSNVFDNLHGGDFTAWVMDDSLCKVSQKVSLKPGKKLLLNQAAVIPTSCGKSNGEVTLPSATGNGLLFYSITGKPAQLSNVFDSLQAGSYRVSATDEEGCSDTLNNILVPDSEGPVISHVNARNPTCGLDDGQLIISATGTGGYSYSLDATTFQPDSAFFHLGQGSFIITVKDGEGCLVEQHVDLVSSCDQPFFLPSAFTPNKDGINDGWNIFFSGSKLEVAELTLHNRWGEVVFHNKPGSIKTGYMLWDGHYKGNVLRGIFTYQIRLVLPEGSNHLYVGTVLAL